MVRTEQDPAQFVPALRRAALRVDPNQPIAAIRTVDEWIGQESAPQRSLATVLTAFAAVALGLVAIGLYGTLSYVTAMRRSEIGVRMAFGAEPELIVRMFLAKTMRLLLIACPIGFAMAWMLTQWMSTWLFGVGITQPMVLLPSLLFLIATVLLATWWPI
jgi:putative ABC transport system permease protein